MLNALSSSAVYRTASEVSNQTMGFVFGIRINSIVWTERENGGSYMLPFVEVYNSMVENKGDFISV